MFELQFLWSSQNEWVARKCYSAKIDVFDSKILLDLIRIGFAGISQSTRVSLEIGQENKISQTIPFGPFGSISGDELVRICQTFDVTELLTFTFNVYSTTTEMTDEQVLLSLGD